MKKLTFAIAMLASIGGASLATSVSAAPGAPMGVTAPETVSTVQMNRMERRMMERRMMERRMMRRKMDRRMMRNRMDRRMMRRM